MTTKTINFRETVSPATRNVVSDNAPVTGNITEIMTHFPPGASALVQVLIKVAGNQILPKDGYLALDDTTPVFKMVEPIELGDLIELDIRNTDNVFSHTITITITCEGSIGTSGPM